MAWEESINYRLLNTACGMYYFNMQSAATVEESSEFSYDWWYSLVGYVNLLPTLTTSFKPNTSYTVNLNESLHIFIIS